MIYCILIFGFYLFLIIIKVLNSIIKFIIVHVCHSKIQKKCIISRSFFVSIFEVGNSFCFIIIYMKIAITNRYIYIQIFLVSFIKFKIFDKCSIIILIF